MNFEPCKVPIKEKYSNVDELEYRENDHLEYIKTDKGVQIEIPKKKLVVPQEGNRKKEE